MARIEVPSTDNPYGVGVTVDNGYSYKLTEAPKTKWGLSSVAEGLVKASDSFIEKEQKKNEEYEKKVEAWQKKVEGMRLQDKTNELEIFRKEISSGSDGFLSKKGKDAMTGEDGASLQDVYAKKFKERYEKLSEDLTTENKHEFAKVYNASLMKLLTECNTHVVKQTGIVAKAVDESTVRIAGEKAVYGSPDEAREGLMVIKAIADKKYAEAGIPENARDYSSTIGSIVSERTCAMLDNGDLKQAKSYFDGFSQYTSLKQKHHMRELFKREEKKHKEIAQTEKLDVLWSQQFGRDSQVLKAVEEVLGKKVNQDDYETALLLTNGNRDEAAQALVVGLDKYEAAWKKEASEGKPVNLKDYIDKEGQARSAALLKKLQSTKSVGSFDEVYSQLYSINPDADPIVLGNTARKIINRQKNEFARVRLAMSDQFMAAFKSIKDNDGVLFESLPESKTSLIPVQFKNALFKYSQRKASGNLVTNSGVYWDLSNRTTDLAKMSDVEFYSYAAEMSPKDFEMLEARRNMSKQGTYVETKDEFIRNGITQAWFNLGVKEPQSVADKKVAGVIKRVLEQAIIEEDRVGTFFGRKMSQEDIQRYVSNFLYTKFSVKGKWFGEDWTSGHEIASTKDSIVSELDNKELTEVLDAGLVSQSILEPNDTNRDEVLLQLLYLNRTPIKGIEAMAQRVENTRVGEEIKRANPKISANALVREYARRLIRIERTK